MQFSILATLLALTATAVATPVANPAEAEAVNVENGEPRCYPAFAKCSVHSQCCSGRCNLWGGLYGDCY